MSLKSICILGFASFAFCVFACKEDDSDPQVCEKVVDYDDSGTVNMADFSEFLRLYDAKDPAADLNCDGKFDDVDGDIFNGFLGN